MRAQRVDKQRVPSSNHRFQRFTIAVLKLLAGEQTTSRPEDQSRQPGPDREIQPHDLVCGAHNAVTKLVGIGAVDHPPILSQDGAQLRPQRLAGCLGPPGFVDESIKLNKNDPQPRRRTPSQRPLGHYRSRLRSHKVSGASRRRSSQEDGRRCPSPARYWCSLRPISWSAEWPTSLRSDAAFIPFAFRSAFRAQ
jgi:hypothetical protein